MELIGDPFRVQDELAYFQEKKNICIPLQSRQTLTSGFRMSFSGQQRIDLLLQHGQVNLGCCDMIIVSRSSQVVGLFPIHQ